MELIYLLIFLISCLIEDIDNVLLKKSNIKEFKYEKILHESDEPSLLQCAQRCRFIDKNSIVDFKNSKCTCFKYESDEGQEHQGTLTGVFVNQKLMKDKKSTERVCYGCKNNEYAKFTVWKTGQLKSIRLTHSSGSLYCIPNNGARWGCPWNGNRAFTVVVTNEQNQLLFPESIGSDSDHYKMKDATINDNQITLSRSLAIDVHNGQILRIWDYQDLKDHYEHNNSGKHCAYVELIYKD